MPWEEIRDAGQVDGIYQGLIENGPRVSLRQLDALDAQQQFLMDLAMWYGFLHKQPDQRAKRWKLGTVCRVFTILLKGGLMVRRSDGGGMLSWTPWHRKGGPVASVISHTARVLVQLPSGAKERQFWEWLWNGARPQGRMAATHGVASDRSRLLIQGIRKNCKENKTGSTCNHYGVNIALGGEGNTNPVSGNRIYPNGEHGHLYFALSKQRFQGRRTLLIATEQSAPLDRHSAKGAGGVKPNLFQKALGKIGGVFTGVPDQYGGSHRLGGHNDRAANGGQDWTVKYLKDGQRDRLGAYGPGPEGDCYLDGLFVDLTNAKFDAIRDFDFTKGMLGLTPEDPV